MSIRLRNVLTIALFLQGESFRVLATREHGHSFKQNKFVDDYGPVPFIRFCDYNAIKQTQGLLLKNANVLRDQGNVRTCSLPWGSSGDIR